jgi:predicted MFS family arabinose efflux permease
VGIPIGIAALVVTERVLRLPFPRRRAKIDYLGAALIFGGVSAILLVLSLGGKQFGWLSAPTLLIGGAGVALLAAAVVQERRAPEPIIPPRLFRLRTFVLTSVAGFAVGAAMFGAIIFLPLYLQIVKGKSPTASGLLTLPLMLGLLTTSIGSGRIITRTGRYKLFPVCGMAITAIGLLALSRLDPGTSLVAAGIAMAVLGIGIGMVMQVLVLATQNAVPRSDLGAATSAATFFRSMGGAFGVAIFGAIMSARVSDTLPRLLAQAHARIPGGRGGVASLLGSPEAIHRLPASARHAVVDAFAGGLHAAFLAAVPFAVAGFVAVVFLDEQPLRSATAERTVEQDLATALQTAVCEDVAAERAGVSDRPPLAVRGG